MKKKIKQVAGEENSKTELMGKMGDEMRAPLASVIGFAQILREKVTDESQKKWADAIQQNGIRLMNLMNDILDFSKFDVSPVELQYRSFCIEDFMRDCMGSIAAKVVEKNITLFWFIDGDVPTVVTGDEGRIRQVLLNLVDNAIKFTHLGEVSIEVKRLNSDSSSTFIEFVVHDTGIGIPEAKMGNLFKPFSQVEESLGSEKGTGLGLVISQRLASAMGGGIEVESEEGVGSTFKFRLEAEVAPTHKYPLLEDLSETTTFFQA